MKKIVKISVLALSLSLCISNAVFAGTWEYAGDGYLSSEWKYWKYKNDDGTYAENCTVEEDGVTYYFNSRGDSIGYGWRNVDKVEALSDEIVKEDEHFNGTPIGILSEYAALYTGTVATTSMALIRQPDGSCELDIRVRITNDRNKKGLKGLTYLLCDDDTLYDVIFNSFEEDNIHNINYDEFVTVGNFQIKAALGQNNRSIIYTIKSM